MKIHNQLLLWKIRNYGAAGLDNVIACMSIKKSHIYAYDYICYLFFCLHKLILNSFETLQMTEGSKTVRKIAYGSSFGYTKQTSIQMLGL